jgi:acyl-[acyl-carrier-protein]-phospholipid O-acyltransferase/long-chain-fatty-acid--[acyl-carrier-protein] ligase
MPSTSLLPMQRGNRSDGAFARAVVRGLLSLLYRVEVHGLENYKAAGDRVLIIGNHTSFLDAMIIGSNLPEKLTFPVNTVIARHWWSRLFFPLAYVFALDPVNPLGIRTLIEMLKQDMKCVIFPEGRITVTGALMKIYEGAGMMADKSGAVLLPVRIDGAQYTPLSRLKGKVRIRWFPKITLTILPPQRFMIPAEAKGRKRRQIANAHLYDVMSQMMFDSSDCRRTLFSSLISAKEVHGRNHIIAEDIERKLINYRQFITRSLVLGRLIERLFPGQKTMGILLPTVVNTSITFFALHAFDRTPAMLNFTAGAAQMSLACKAANVSTILTSRRFLEKGKLEAVAEDLTKEGITIVCLEDLRAQLKLSDKLFAIAASYVPRLVYLATSRASVDDPAVILFTSGSEGTPKGVALSHANIQANRFQLASRIHFGPRDSVFNCMPMFHAFGLTGGTLLPILSGIKTFYYPSPLHYRIVPELIYDTDSTVLFGTDTFLAGYARFAHPYDFYSVRYIFSGAEKLKDETRKVYAEKFRVCILEGYGATETAPVLSTNTPMQNRAGTVGRLMPGIAYKLENVPGITEGGELFVKGPNIMLGYLRADAPGKIQPIADGWYDTGDIVDIDVDGYVSIKGRTKRFAKVGGEMVSLAAVEAAIAQLWPDYLHAVVTVPDMRRGEQLVLLTQYEKATRDNITQYFRSQKMSELSIPRKIIAVKSIPLLGTGKTDYQQAQAIALEAENMQKIA